MRADRSNDWELPEKYTGKGAMVENLNQPREYDAVLGGQTKTPANAAVLGGIEGIKRRLASAVEEHRIAALKDAPKYGEAGLDLVIQALQNESRQVMWAAYRLLRERAEPRVKQILQEYNPWRPFERLYTFGWHSDWVKSVAISPDGQTLVSGSRDKTIKVWNLHTGKLSRNFAGHSDTVETVAISADGHIIVSGSHDKTIKVWNLHARELIRTLVGHSDQVYCVAISADGQIIVSGGSEETIKVWNLHTGELIRTIGEHLWWVNSADGHSHNVVKTVAISPDGQTFVSGSDDATIKVWNLHTGKLIRTLAGHSYWVNTVAISADEHIIVSGSRDKTIKVWNLHTGELERTLAGHSNSVYCVAISPDGQTLVSGSREEIIVWGVR
ncbi:MAG TPA: WD40 repeat domain-containing protein [Candidatus Sericytochromatia bacterium]